MKGQDANMDAVKSWDGYYRKFNGMLLRHHRLNIYLRDNAKTLEQLHKLGYTEALYTDDHEEFEGFLAIGQYCYTTTFEGDEDEIEVDVIEIQHPPAKDYVCFLQSLGFMSTCTEVEIRQYAAQNFGFSSELVHSICMMDGRGFWQEAKKYKDNRITTPIAFSKSE